MRYLSGVKGLIIKPHRRGTRVGQKSSVRKRVPRPSPQLLATPLFRNSREVDAMREEQIVNRLGQER